MINIKSIEKRRNRMMISISELSKKSGVTRQTYYNLINKKHTPSLTVLRKLAEALGLKIKNLV